MFVKGISIIINICIIKLKYLKLNDSENVTCQNQWRASQALLRRKPSLKVCGRKWERLKIRHSIKLEKEPQDKIKKSKKVIIIKDN